VLLDDSHVGATYELGGPRLVSVWDVASEAGRVLGRPVTAARIDPEEWAAGPGSSLEPRLRDGLLAMYRYYDEHGLPAGGRVLRDLLGGPSTPVRETLERELADTP
jgi:uncharacterized protein YbjT (DUF2867 family)